LDLHPMAEPPRIEYKIELHELIDQKNYAVPIFYKVLSIKVFSYVFSPFRA